MDREGAETHLRLLAEAELRRVMMMPAGSIPGRSWRVLPAGQVITIRDGDLRREVFVVACVQSAGGARFIVDEWPFDSFTCTPSPVPGQLAGLCARLGITGHGITAPPAPGILAATVAELPELDGAKITIAGGP